VGRTNGENRSKINPVTRTWYLVHQNLQNNDDRTHNTSAFNPNSSPGCRRVLCDELFASVGYVAFMVSFVVEETMKKTLQYNLVA